MHELFTASESVWFTIATMIITTSNHNYNHEPFFPERLLSFFKVCLLRMSSVLMFSWMQLLWQSNGARCQHVVSRLWRCSPKLEKISCPSTLFIFEDSWQHDLVWFFWVILTFDWNKASSIYQQEGLVCWYCLLFFVRVLNAILNHSTTTILQVLYLLEEMDQNLDRQIISSQLPSCQWNIHPFLHYLLIQMICEHASVRKKDLGSNRQTHMTQQTTTTSQRFAMSLFVRLPWGNTLNEQILAPSACRWDFGLYNLSCQPLGMLTILAY